MKNYGMQFTPFLSWNDNSRNMGMKKFYYFIYHCYELFYIFVKEDLRAYKLSSNE